MMRESGLGWLVFMLLLLTMSSCQGRFGGKTTLKLIGDPPKVLYLIPLDVWDLEGRQRMFVDENVSRYERNPSGQLMTVEDGPHVLVWLCEDDLRWTRIEPVMLQENEVEVRCP